MTVERSNGQENKSLFNSRLFKFGVFIAALGAALGKFKLAAVGVVISGASWAAWKGK